MNTHSLFGYLFIALFSLLVVSCYSTPDGVMSSLSQAEKIMESRPDSAMAILQHIPTPETLHGKAQADYSLLMTQAMDKKYINFTSDSLIKFAVGYYGGHTEDLVAKGKSFYYYGRVMESLDKVEDAMTFYLKAKDVLQSSDQFKLLGLVTEKIGDLNRRQKLLDAALNDYKESFDFYASIPDSLCMLYAYRNLGRGFLYKNQIDSAYYYYDKALYILNLKKYSAVGSILLELGVIHRSEKDYVGAEQYFLSFIEKEKDPEKLFSGYLALGNLYLYMDRLKDAERYLLLCLGSSNLVIKRDACECLYDLEKELNNFKGAIGYKDIADSLRIITQDIDIQNSIATLQSRYNSEKWQRESLLVAATQLGEVLEIYNLQNGFHRVCLGPKGEPEFKLAGGYAIPDGIMGFSDVQVTNEAIYAVFHGHTFKEIMAQHQKEGRATDGGQYIYVFNLQGEPLCKYTLDRYITGFHVDERNKTITATDVNNDQPIVEFRFG